MAQDKTGPASGGGAGPLVKLSRKSADLLVVCSIGLLVVLFVAALLLSDGLTVTFDARGGTDVPAARQLAYGDPLPAVNPPTREGYAFTGWYRDPDCSVAWDQGTDRVTEDVTVYAGWQSLP